ncbi:DENN domain and WD repeat-containing protein SCD1 [Gossypium australe]|uniref:DENN domain and WD repeat-containing protein SCD1 n=1 Tax=Gossypium australe TaxID=47621 RepID=A0A5B6UGX5_9ROSI|nr:DENN domain and WD repeat-containing protein SCD1 [Gossypium australe]
MPTRRKTAKSSFLQLFLGVPESLSVFTKNPDREKQKCRSDLKDHSYKPTEIDSSYQIQST